jgi:hypothetical protein
MANVVQQLDPGAAQFLATAFPALTKGGTNFPVIGLAFDAATAEGAFWEFRATNYASGDVSVSVDWYADTATSGVVVWGAQVKAITPDTDTTDVETASLATAVTVSDTHLGTTAQRIQRAPTIALTGASLDSLAAEDAVWIRVYRDAANGSDTLAGDALIVGVTVSYLST